VGSIPLRSFGQFSIRVDSPKALLMTLIGSRSAYDITELEAWVQGEILENLPRALSEVQNLDDLGRSQEKVALRLRELVQAKLQSAGVSLTDLQVLSILPSQEVLKALDERKAMSLIGDPRQYLLYKAANSLDALHASGSSDGMQMMLGLMLGKGLLQGPQVLSSSDLSKPTQKQLLGDC
jgi:membrane protease subunit (stomatin/prohibitin family)